jgi:hypothetical protein
MAVYVKELPCGVTHSGLFRINFNDILSESGVLVIHLNFSLNPCDTAKVTSLQHIYCWHNFSSDHRNCVHTESNSLVIVGLLIHLAVKPRYK